MLAFQTKPGLRVSTRCREVSASHFSPVGDIFERASMFHPNCSHHALAVFEHGAKVALHRGRQAIDFLGLVAGHARRQARRFELMQQGLCRFGPVRPAMGSQAKKQGDPSR